MNYPSGTNAAGGGGGGSPISQGPLGASVAESRAEVKRLEIVIAALTKMMGGSVVIHESEMRSAAEMTLVTTVIQDPMQFIVRVEE